MTDRVAGRPVGLVHSETIRPFVEIGLNNVLRPTNFGWTWEEIVACGAMMVIKFLCPNRHPLKSDETRAGKPGQCPRCLTEFLVPLPDASQAGEMVVAAARSRVSRPSAVDPSDESGKFMFLCPNGHKLHGSPDQQGRPGQCPHCNMRFLIPTANDGPEMESEPATEYEHPEVVLDEPARWEFDDFRSAANPDDSVQVQDNDEPPPPPLPVSCHPLAQVIRRLWAETRGAGVLELQLDGEEAIVAESFSAELSQHEFGVFAIRGDAKTPAVAIIPWASITRATLRNLADLPCDLFRSTPPTRRR